MPIPYQYDPDQNMVIANPFGVATVKAICAYFQEIFNDPRVAPGFIEVAHFDGVEDFAFRYTESNLIITAYSDFMVKKKCAGTVIVAREDLAYGIARMLSLVYGKPKNLRVVRTDDELGKALSDIRSQTL